MIIKPARPLIFVLSIVYWILASQYHIVVTEFLTDYWYTPWGRILPKEYTLQIAGFFYLLLLIFIIYRFVRGTRRKATVLYWVFIFIAMILTYQILITTPIELIHYPQYALLSIFISYSLDPKKDKFLVIRVLIIATILGILDEAYQYLYLTMNSSDYLDFNDFFLNEVGVSLGLMIYYGFAAIPAVKDNVKKMTVSVKKIILSFSILTILVMLFYGRIYFRTQEVVDPGGFTVKDGKIAFVMERKPNKFGHWVEKDKGIGNFYILDPFLGTLILILYGMLFGTFDNRFYYSFVEVLIKKNLQ